MWGDPDTDPDKSIIIVNNYEFFKISIDKHM